MAVSGSRVVGGAASGAATGTAILPGWGTAIGAVVGGLVGALSGDGGEEAARDAMQKAMTYLEGVGMPPDLSGPILYQQLQAGGHLTPQLEGVLQEEMYNAVQAKDNAQTRTQLTSALEGIRSKAFGGLTPQQMANQQKLLQQTNAGTQSQLRGILQGQAQQGKSGSGDALAAMLNATQGGAQQNSQNALQIGAQGAQSQDAALRDYLSGVGSLRSQDDSRNEYNASAQNAAYQAKLVNASARQRANVGNMNEANQFNLNRTNQVNDYNTQLSNQEKLRQVEAKRQQWLDQLQLATAKSNAQMGQATNMANMANNSNQGFNTMMGSIGDAGAAYGRYSNNQNLINAYKDRTSAMSTPPANNPPHQPIPNPPGYSPTWGIPQNNNNNDDPYNDAW